MLKSSGIGADAHWDTATSFLSRDLRRTDRRTVSDRIRIFLLSFLMLFAELALIRWTGENVLSLSFFSNFVLLGSFLGIGIGFLRAAKAGSLFRYVPIGLFVLISFVLVFPIRIGQLQRDQIIFFGMESSGLPIWVSLPVIFVLVAFVLAGIAEGLARVFAKFEPLDAYRLDILGAVAGTVAFSVLSFLGTPPIVWGIVVAALLGTLIGPRLEVVAPLAAILAILAVQSVATGSTWSAYYKIDLFEREVQGTAVTDIRVNGIPHQAVVPVAARPELTPVYFKPYERLAPGHPLDDVLIVGAGNGGDVAIALEEGAGHVDAVEIDARLFELGSELNPDRPYANPLVTRHVDDGRAFLERTDRRYDLVLFALPDSLTLVSGQSSLRLESFLFTEEAIAQARDVLRPGGVFAMYNYYREDWLIERLGSTMSAAFGVEPCVDLIGDDGGLAMLAVSTDPAAIDCTGGARLDLSTAPAAVTDDRPFLYLKDPGIPSLYLVTMAAILGLSLVAVRATAGSMRTMTGYVDLFFMGVAFLLLETKNVVQFALLFGTTWFVNALVFAGILLTVLAAIEVAKLRRLPRGSVLYGALFASLAVAWAVPPSWLLTLSVPVRFVVATTLAFAPIFLANVVFAQRFKGTSSSTTAFGANLLGAMVGGLLEYASLIVGYRSLLIAAAALYGLAYLTGYRHLEGRGPEPVVTPAMPVAAGRESVVGR